MANRITPATLPIHYRAVAGSGESLPIGGNGRKVLGKETIMGFKFGVTQSWKFGASSWKHGFKF
jgi:hypothetical protein